MRFIAVFCLILGVISTALTVRYYFESRNFLRHGFSSLGQVVSWEKQTMPSNETVFYPRIRFTDNTGHEREFTSTFGYEVETMARTEEIPVVYNQTEPIQAKISDYRELWSVPFGSACGAIANFLLSAVVFGFYYFGKRKRVVKST